MVHSSLFREVSRTLSISLVLANASWSSVSPPPKHIFKESTAGSRVAKKPTQERGVERLTTGLLLSSSEMSKSIEDLREEMMNRPEMRQKKASNGCFEAGERT